MIQRRNPIRPRVNPTTESHRSHASDTHQPAEVLALTARWLAHGPSSTDPGITTGIDTRY